MQDDTPTPKQTGSFAIMQTACEDPLKSLAKWKAESASGPSDGWSTWDKIVVFEGRFTVLLEQVKSWAHTPPTQETKSKTIQDIMDARDDAKKWGEEQGRGWKL